MDKMFKDRSKESKKDSDGYLPSGFSKTFYPDDINLSYRDKELVERTYYLFKVIRKLLKTFADNSKCKRGLYVAKIETQIDECFAEAKCASWMWQRMLCIYDQVTHDIAIDNCRDDYIIAMNRLYKL